MLAVLYPIDVARVRLHMNYFRIAQEGLYKGIPSALTLVKLDKRTI